MNYELAKELKEAGYLCIDWTKTPFDEIVPNPTLSELIEACGKPVALQVEDDKCTAQAYGENKPRTTEYGATPEEAMAKLWLALNKK